MIDDVRARVANIQARFGPKPSAGASTSPTPSTAAGFDQLLAAQGVGGAQAMMRPNAFAGSGGVTLAQMLAAATAPQPGLTPGWAAPMTPAWAGHGAARVGSVPERAAFYQPEFESAGARHGVDPKLLSAVAWTESNFNPDAVSHAGALGMMQIMPGTAAGLGVDPRDPVQAIDGAARYLRTQLDRFGDVRLALAAYNAGPGAVERHGGVPPYPETTAYVGKVLGRYDRLRSTP